MIPSRAALAAAVGVVLSGLASTSPLSTKPGNDSKVPASKAPPRGFPEASSNSATFSKPGLSALTLPGEIEFHVPHTSTTLFLKPLALPLPYSALREITSRALTEVDAILDIAGDGILPGSKHQYKKSTLMSTAHGFLKVRVTVDSTQLSSVAHHLMTYGILREALLGLLDFARVDKQESKINNFRIQHGDLGNVGLGYFTWEHDASERVSANNNLPASRVLRRSTEKNTSRADPIPSLAESRNADPLISYLVPNTYTTIRFKRSETPQCMLATIRMLLSRSLVEVRSILGSVGDGILPAPEHEYRKSQPTIITGDTWESADILIISSNLHESLDNLMTYQILHDTLQGLWDIFVVYRQVVDFHQHFMIDHARKGLVGIGSVVFH
ncbi:MAG: hypothetical protein Q9207_007394 [Kuettlingeria erythrocarpa]